MTFEPRSYVVEHDWSHPNAAFDLSSLPVERADAVLVQWAMAQRFETALKESEEWKYWTDFMADHPVDRHRLYYFLSGERLGRFEIFAAIYVAFVDTWLPTPMDVHQLVEGAKQRSREWQRRR